MTTEIIHINYDSDKVTDWKIMFNDEESIAHRKGSLYFYVVNKEGYEVILDLSDIKNVIAALNKLNEVVDDYRSN